MSKHVHVVVGVALASTLGGVGAGGCRRASDTLEFSELPPAASDAEKRSVRSTDVVEVAGRELAVGYQTLLRSGQTLGDTFGELRDDHGKPLLIEDGSRPIADSNDFSSLLPVDGKLYSVSQFESQPGAMFITELRQATDGKLAAQSVKTLDLSGIHGIWNPCAGSVTPWNTHLGSEEYEPDAKNGVESAKTMAPYFGGGETLGGDLSQVNPYYYGFPVEVAVTSADGDYSVAKHYSLGRFAHELSYVMPDRKTVYQSDDGTNVGFFMYVADRAGDLSAGTLYAAKWHQTSPAGEAALGTADIEWLELGHASDSELSTLIDGGITFADIFDSKDPNDDGSCAEGFHAVNANGAPQECLALKAGQEQAAAFLESRRYAGYVGATTELRKEEGITFDAKSGTLFVAYSEVQYGMEDGKKNGTAEPKYDVGTPNDVRLKFNTCGAVYAYEVGEAAGIASRYVVTQARGLLAGRMTTLIDPDKLDSSTVDAYPEESPFVNSTCDINGIANPDNLSFIAEQNILLIGEDTGDGHQNDAVWSYDLDNSTLTRIMTTPYGAETTSLYYYPNVGGYGYVVTVVQHPYGESDTDKLTDPGDKHSYFGVFGPLPAAAK